MINNHFLILDKYKGNNIPFFSSEKNASVLTVIEMNS